LCAMETFPEERGWTPKPVVERRQCPKAMYDSGRGRRAFRVFTFFSASGVFTPNA